MSNEVKILSYEARIQLLSHRDPVENAHIINKLKRKIRLLEKQVTFDMERWQSSVDCTGLENQHTGDCIVGSNPTLSAIYGGVPNVGKGDGLLNH